MSLSEKSVFQDHLDMGNVYQWLRYHGESVVFVIIILVQSTAMVTLPPKLLGGAVPGLGLVWVLGAFLSIGLALINPLQTLRAMIAGWPFVALIIWVALSNSWTITPYETQRGTLLYVASHLFAFAVAARFSWKRFIELQAWTLCVLVALSIVLAIGFPSAGQMQGELAGAWSGVWAEKQGLSFHACHALLASLAMVWMGPKYRWWWIAIVMCVVAILGSTGKTALAMTGLAVMFGLWLRIFYRGFAGRLIGTWVAALGALIAVPIATGTFDFLLKAAGKTTDLSGRTEIWAAVRQVGDMQPHHGWGYQAIWRGKDDVTSPFQWIIERADFAPANAHSSWLDTYLQLGNVGVALLIICMVWAWASLLIKANIDNIALAFSGATFLAITFISFSETNLVTPMEFQWMLICLICCKVYLTPNRHKVAQEEADAADAASRAGELDGDTYTYG